MIADQAVHSVRTLQQIVPFVLVVLIRNAAAGSSAIVVKRPAVKFIELPLALFGELRKEPPRPAEIAAIRTRADKLQLDAIGRKPRCKPAKFLCILLGQKVAAAAP